MNGIGLYEVDDGRRYYGNWVHNKLHGLENSAFGYNFKQSIMDLVMKNRDK